MHEMSLVSSLLRIVLEEAKKRETGRQRLQVTGVRLEAGALTGLMPETLEGCFALMAEGTAAEGARLEVRIRPLTGYCPDCGEEVSAGRRIFSCPRCSGCGVDWKGGREMEIMAIDVVPFSRGDAGAAEEEAV
ncbi:MAG: hydrogenase maturation nickel metallochaperone HypA [Desulfovibrio sp.]|jgi:hydrogenase nickel incorporation protein HypA/HybF|nr:hydrogenase maturation nickel metallochaperone HypA [Desulfovibrio sp.]